MSSLSILWKREYIIGPTTREEIKNCDFSINKNVWTWFFCSHPNPLKAAPSILCDKRFLVFVSVKSMWSGNHGGSLVFADVELSFLKDSFGTKIFKWPP